MAASRAPDELILGRYRRRAVVGTGSFGRVLEVFDVQANELRALKVVPRGPHELTLLDEFAQLARLRHPSLPRVFEVGRTRESIENVEAGSPFFVAEWIAGVRADARAWSATPKGDAGAALWALLADIAGALATIHAAGVVHADVAPQNILVTGDGKHVLVDLGLASASAAARGTPAYMAPEALAGFLEPRSDLYGLGATVIRLVTGRPPFEAPTLGELVQRIMRGGAPRALPGVPAPLADLIGRLVAREADARPASALAVLDELDQLAPALAPGSLAEPWSFRRARPKVGPPPAPSAWPGADAWISTLESSLAARAVTIVHGPADSGARMLVDVALRRRQLDEVGRGKTPAPMVAGSIDAIAAQLGVAAAPNARAWIERTARAIRGVRAPVVIELGDDPRASTLVAALARLVGDDPVLVLVDGPPRELPPGVALQPAPSLDVPGVSALAQSMLGQPVPRTWAAALHAASSGQPLAIVELVSAVADARDPFAIDWSARSSTSTVEHRAKQIRALADGPRRALAILATLGGRARVDRVLAVSRACVAHARADKTDKDKSAEPDVALGDITDLERASLVRRHQAREGAQLTIDRATIEAVEQVVGAAPLGAIAVRALAAALPADPPDLLAPLLERAPLDAVLGERACRVAEALLAGGRGDRALAIAKHALDVVPARAGLVAARAASTIAADASGYRAAAAHARAAIAAGADPIEAELVIARAAQKAGDLDAAETALAALHRAHPDHAEVAGAYARLLVTRSRYADAREVALAGTATLAGLRAEAAGLAAFYLGDLEAADTAFAALEVASAASDDHTNVGRALSLRGMVAQQRGRLGLASDRYREAARRLSDAGELHAAATAELNLGTVLAERGRASEALPRLAAAGRVFAELGATTELIAADLNRGNALVAVGQPDDARLAAEAALARAHASPHLKAFALLVLGDARRKLGDDAGAHKAYREALDIGIDRDDAHAQVHAFIALAEAGVDAAGAAKVDVDALCASEDDRDRWTLARGRLALRDPRLNAVAAGELARACAAVASRASTADRLDRAFRAHALAAQLATRARDTGLASAEADQARAVHAALVGAAAPAFRTALEADSDLVALPGTPRVQPPRASTHDQMPLRRLLSLSRRLNSEASVERILDEVIDTAIELTSAERGFLLLRQADGELAAVVSRNFSTGDAENQSVSRSIAERAAQTGEPVMTVDAGVDERFGAAASVAALRLRSVLAVPLRQRGAIIGCIYVDHRLRGGAFDEGAASVLGELADIAAIAIENARLADDLRRKSHEVDELNGRLSSELADRDAELVRVKADLPDRDRLRNRYERIVGRSPSIVRMLDVVDRAAATSLPVVIVGESGTGKELVARALHDNGPRKAGPFVAINCSAVPEPLLESELFGHVRGSFTGADRDRRGLFEVADGGTLFLDEIADTSMAMQAKLLRVLQDGMIRRVGDTKTHKVDVRVIAATQLPLAELVTAGRFREDLRFRVEVISVAIPALRDRDGDVPLLVEQLLAQIAAGKPPPRLTRNALRALAAHRWPGNVRELENALARGLAMGGDVIDVGDLPEAIANAAARPEPAKPAVGEDLRLKPALLSTEQAYISAAMGRAKNNQTVAARLLGLSRFGLQKKLRRLSGQDDAGNDDE